MTELQKSAALFSAISFPKRDRFAKKKRKRKWSHVTRHDRQRQACGIPMPRAIIQRPVQTQSAIGPSNAISRCPVAGEIHAAADLACNITAKVNGILCCLEL